ncbi:HesA/MoeB/ThiF family protein [Pseudomonas synxantha]|uniref:HesA/MoeB/ThiF family protein n=1 Tax=Pseudomonas synxantha TaxID=47883 RepID=A0ABS0UDD0_9PSED|nr:HesA/MoeB/ThiF family protein [Pseudomonas synxantha]MBI6563334.1 HesA/MoeB/ThiF family protein [Pseudomonas synxantha]MBI6582138.1 HesA/MoeB/ThiF family protein [Pseudomonas synxantha]MBI6645921.1 HesA/MoeB/ThiF family protein [Pseudomonas synxantha]MDQ0982207.1 molybdopterin/thiamine biosynthesis adenylyltransferase/rhodanese-related sulfurtransferase [Pseudomonas synxantha]
MQCDLKTDTSRYARQIILSEVGAQGQQRLKDSKVLVVGAGGLGCPVLLYLAGAGVGTLGIVDNDIVDLSNLHRQILYGVADVGELKVSAAKRRVNQLNPDIVVDTFATTLNPDNVLSLLASYDIIVDATDNFDTKYLISDACVAGEKPMVYASISQFEGQVSVFNHYHQATQERGPCFRDLFETPPPPHLTQNCAQAGVLGVIPGLLGCFQANEVLKLILQAGEPLSGKLLSIDCLDNTFHLLSVHKNRNRLPAPALGASTTPAWRDSDWLSPDKLHDWLESQAPFQLVDVRDSHEHLHASLGGRLIPLKDILDRRQELDTTRRIVFYCKSGVRSKAALLAVRSIHPHAELFSLEGGIERYLTTFPDNATLVAP